MVRIFLSGTPGSGKTRVIKQAQAIMEKLGYKLHYVSVGEIISENAANVGVINLMRSGSAIQTALRSSGLIQQCIGRLREFKKYEHVIVDCPLTLMSTLSVPYLTFDFRDFRFFEKSGRGIDRVVTLIESPHIVSENLTASDFATSLENILIWTANEVNRAADFASAYTTSRPVVTTTETAAANLVKLMLDTSPPIGYSGYPISKIRDRPDFSSLLGRINDFKWTLQKMVVLITPLTIADLKAATPAEKEHAKARDLSQLIGRQARWIFGYFPINVHSPGLTRELTEGEQLGKYCVLIHPEPDRTPFGEWNTQYLFKAPEDFVAAVAKARKTSDRRPFQEFTLEDGTFRYAKIMDAAEQLFPRNTA